MRNLQFAADLLTMGAWITWAALWLVLAGGVKPAVRREGLLSRALHLGPLLLGAFLLVGGPMLPAWLNAPILPVGPWLALPGVALVAAGLALATWARFTLGGNWSGTVTVKHRHELIRTGPYAFARHPIYTGLLIALLGTACTANAWRALTALLIIAASFLRKMRTEEAFMRDTFGPAYDTYRAEVAALFPGIY